MLYFFKPPVFTATDPPALDPHETRRPIIIIKDFPISLFPHANECHSTPLPTNQSIEQISLSHIDEMHLLDSNTDLVDSQRRALSVRLSFIDIKSMTLFYLSMLRSTPEKAGFPNETLPCTAHHQDSFVGLPISHSHLMSPSPFLERATFQVLLPHICVFCSSSRNLRSSLSPLFSSFQT